MRLFVKEQDTEREVLEMDFLKGTIPLVYVHQTGKDLKESESTKSVSHSIRNKHILSEFFNNGKKSHSSEIDFDVAISLLNGPGGDRKTEQTDEDDNNFWKNPINQTA